ncbi:hypothetical protein AAG570_000810 [Ranatra chinensis]|uniref:Uncharacterized protein n=1 Tax=Ranatra chinensis TaxID=642074 RepID=A0ABD0YY64_9HEMI
MDLRDNFSLKEYWQQYTIVTCLKNIHTTLKDMKAGTAKEETEELPEVPEGHEEEVGLTMERLSHIVKTINDVQDAIEDWDPEMNRALQFQNALTGAMQPYKKNSHWNEERVLSTAYHIEEDEGNDGEALKDILTLPDNLLHTDLVNTIMKEQDGEIKSENIISADSGVSESPQLNESGSSQKDELSDILGPHFNIESMVRETGLPNMDSKDVEEIFKGVLTDESQESQSSGVFPLRGPTPGTPAHPQLSPQGIVPSGNLVGSRPISTLPSVVHSNLSSPVTFPSASPYNSEYSNSPQFSPEGSPWGGDENGCSYNQRTSIKMESDEALGQSATISAVLYANMNHPEWRTEYPNWSERCKQIVKKWRALPSEMKAPYLLQARENRTNLRMKKAQQMGKELSSGGGANESERSAAGKSSEVSCQPPVKITLPQQRGGTSPTAEQKLVSTASNTSPPLHSSETFPTTIPSHPSTIQYIPLNAPGIKATFHIIPNTIVTTSSTSSSSSSSTSETPAPPPPLARTIHYPPPNVLLQPVPPPLVVTSNPQQPSDQPGGLLQVTKAQQAPPHSNKRPPPTPVDTATTASTIAPTSTATSTLASSSPLSDQHIRVLTPSEIMRTLPSLGQETYDTSPSTVEQDKVQAAKTCREAEQERQWKQLQAMRQQQMLTQNRPQGITKVTRQISSDGTVVQYTNEPVSTQTHLTQQLQVSTTQDSPSLPVMSPRGAPQFTSPSGVKVVRPPTVVGAPVGGVPVGGVPRAQLRPPQPASFVPHPTVPTQQQQPQQPPPTVVRQPIPADEMNRQLRDLLQRHHTKQDASDGSPLLSPTVVNAPLQATTTPQLRLPITQVRPPTLQHHPAAQGIDARVRLLLQQQRAAAAAFPSQVRVAAPRPHVDQFNLMTRPQQFHSITSQNATVVRASQPPTVAAEQVRIQQVERIQGREGGEEIPDSVTAELEKLEQEGGSMAEVEAVSAILGDLVEDDDELLAEMGADFNILEYADPELDNVSGGEKTNIFDDLEDEVEKKKHLNENRQVKTEEMVKQEHMDSTKSTKKAEHCPQSSGTSVAVTGGVAGSGVVTAATAEKQTEVTTVVDPSTIAVVSSTTSVPQPQPPQQNTLSTQGLPQVTVASSASFSSQFAAPTTPIPRLPTLQVGVQPAARAQVLAGSQGQGFMQIPPPPYPGPPPPYPGQQMRVGVPRTVVQPAPQQQQQQQQRRSLLLQDRTGNNDEGGEGDLFDELEREGVLVMNQAPSLLTTTCITMHIAQYFLATL